MLRSPVTVQVLNAMASMDMPMFKKHLPEFYPSFTKLICSDQVWCIFVLNFSFFSFLHFLWAMFVSSKKGCAKCCYVLFSRVGYTLLKNFYFEEWSRCPKNSNFKDGIERELMDNFLLWQCRWMCEEHSEIFSKCN
jgi:hypothetical protein